MMHGLAMMQVGGAVPTSAFDLIRSASPVTRATSRAGDVNAIALPAG